MAASNRLCAVLLLTLAACGPGQAASATSATETSTTTTSSSETETSTSQAESEAGSETPSDPTIFVPDEDWPVCGGCDPWVQDCAEGEKCVPYASTGGNWDANKCVTILGDAAPGEPCIYDGRQVATDTCDATSVCWNATEVEGELVGTCHLFCEGTPDDPSCPPGYFCPQGGDGSVTLCFTQCDPLAQDCDEGLSCYYTATSFTCVVESSNIPAGQPCGFFNDCEGGTQCVSGELVPACEGSSCCAPYCALDEGDVGCASLPGTSCEPFFDVPEPGQDNIGICLQ